MKTADVAKNNKICYRIKRKRKGKMLACFNVPVYEVADYFLSKINEEYGDCISNLKLQKLVYFAQGFVLAITGKTLFKDEILAWQHGPVVRSLYDKYKDYGASCIKKPETFNFQHLNNEEITEILDDVYNTYGQFSAWKLRDLTHLPNSPWTKAEINTPLKLTDMQTYFKGLLV